MTTMRRASRIPHTFEVERNGKVIAIVKGYLENGTFMVVNVDTVGVVPDPGEGGKA